jgi:polysaccharide deacetylase family protein (PEP-CTERM system associated)
MHSRQSDPKPVMVTVDLEDWFQVENLRPLFPQETWDACELRVEMNVQRLLELFDACRVEATFFVLGWVAERRPGLVREIARAGHEIASHGYSHRLCPELAVPELRRDIETSRALLQDITGQPPVGYRAPSFSITGELTDILAELGFAYDSSYNSFGLNGRYGRAEGLRQTADGYLTAGSGIVELPVSNLALAGRTVPWAARRLFQVLADGPFRARRGPHPPKGGTLRLLLPPLGGGPGSAQVCPRDRPGGPLQALPQSRQTMERLGHLLHRFRAVISSHVPGTWCRTI